MGGQTEGQTPDKKVIKNKQTQKNYLPTFIYFFSKYIYNPQAQTKRQAYFYSQLMPYIYTFNYLKQALKMLKKSVRSEGMINRSWAIRHLQPGSK